MTRWARIKSTHGTKRQPEEATSWQDFQKQRKQLNETQDPDTKLVTVEKGIHREPDKKRKITNEEHKRLKKKKQLKKMREQREKKGMVLLPEKIERKIYRMKKAMRAKDKTAQEIREEIRRFRRKEELAYRKLCLKACLHCRQPGHKVADCPQAPRVGICYKCGASDHTSANCLQVAGDSYMFAACFVCGEQGHISRECPKNEKGAFPKGGGCRFCGSNKHKKQDCPDRKAAKRINNEEQDEVVADVLTNDKDSADKEIHRDTSLFMRSVRTSGLSGKPTGTSSTRRKPKFVKF
ncbi:zinc finger CCHC domain-containing protein 9-like isoform X2 [Varroa jacobsoni]|nr:zinc finger CCHC domain-containing protein 9-like isoform X2 [Varroa destructor]XP_022694459.1 zinc finger CCHC domain-containing protein 9-like isoform X2 [Varroa jacobsoni]XP_022694460.1 zinc finger CCHC domain-containing protein 9-like isoform X2 [Varroa jacobsoni]